MHSYRFVLSHFCHIQSAIHFAQVVYLFNRMVTEVHLCIQLVYLGGSLTEPSQCRAHCTIGKCLLEWSLQSYHCQ